MNDLASVLTPICAAAGQAILGYYQKPSTWGVQAKADDSPITLADLKANEIITQALNAFNPDIPILSEEGAHIEYAQRLKWGQYWLIDPLDGTKEFIEKTDEFTINIALVENHRPVFGMVYAPVLDIYYWGDCRSKQAWKKSQNKTEVITSQALMQKSTDSPLVVVASRRHSLESLKGCIEKLETKFGRVEKKSVGSALKICQVADGSADIYPRFGPTSEWDTAAGEAILNASGGSMFAMDFSPLMYNKKSLINPGFFAVGDTSIDWQTILR